MSRPVIILEFDDVLVETRAPKLVALRTTFAQDGVSIDDGLLDTVCLGVSMAAAVRNAYRQANVPADETTIELAALRADRAFAAASQHGLPLAPGAREFVLNAAGQVRLAIVTSARRRDVEALLEFAGLRELFECVLTADDHAGAEPSPDLYDAALFRLAYGESVRSGGETAMVASLNAIAAARAARLNVVVVGPVSPTLAFAGDGYLASLQGVTVADAVRLSRRVEAL